MEMMKKPIKQPMNLGNGHSDTILPFLFRPIKKQNYERERIYTDDNDFLDLDWIKNNQRSLVILSHGLESSSRAQYIQGMADYFKKNGYDVLAWNCRGCSGEVNKTLKYYHSGASYDLETVVNHAIAQNLWENIFLIGFSLGGNLTLKYAGENAEKISPKIKGVCVFSTPCCLKTSSYKLKSGFNKIYTNEFLKTLKQKVYAKEKQLNENGFDTSVVRKLHSLPDFDEYFTAPLHGFKDANDYYEKCSSKDFISGIRVSTLIVNAQNDPFLSPECFPYKVVSENQFVSMEVPKSGGHVGFYTPSFKNILWSEKRAFSFFENL
ncbi:MAG: putative alpha/beta-fold hydrolase [Bacteriovoracaceae bacterium]|jgi:predicted alpha/beta-fold hydrolase